MSLARIQELYAYARDMHGMTVAEWEAMHGYPRFTVYPSARFASKPTQLGYAMYERRRAEPDAITLEWKTPQRRSSITAT